MTKAQDPFAPTADPGLYVEREATEGALQALRRIAFEESGNALLRGPTGTGKSLLLRVLARQAEGELTCVHVPVPSLDPEGLITWIASRLPRTGDTGGAEALLQTARECGILLLVEDAEHLPEESARALAELYRASDHAIRSVLTSSADETPPALVEAFDSGLEEVGLAAPMSRAETADYIAQRLAAAGVPPSVAERFDAPAIDQIFAKTDGVPSRVNQAAREHMPAAAKPLATSVPVQEEPAAQGALWQDPFPEPRSEPPARPARRRPRRHAPRPAKKGRSRRGWGLAILAGAATFAVGLLLGPWLRGPAESPVAAREAAQSSTANTPRASAPGAGEEVASARAKSGGQSEPRAEQAEPTGVPAATSSQAEVAAVDIVPAEAAPAPSGERPVRGAVEPAESGTPIRESAPPQTAAARPAPEPEATPAPPAAAPAPSERVPGTGEVSPGPVTPEAQAIIGPRAVAGTKPPFERTPETPREVRAFLLGADAPPPATGEAIVSLRSDRPASIEIDGQVVGQTPLRIGGLEPGPHRIVVRFVDGITMSRTIDVAPGEREFTLLGPVRRPPPPASQAEPGR